MGSRPESGPTHRSPREVARRGGLVLLASWLVNWSIIVIVTRFEVVPPYEHLDFAPVTVWTTVGVIGALLVYGIVDRYSTRPDRRFLQIAIAVLLLSVIPDLWLLDADPEATVGAVTLLMAMHVIVAGICILGLTDYRPEWVRAVI